MVWVEVVDFVVADACCCGRRWIVRLCGIRGGRGGLPHARWTCCCCCCCVVVVLHRRHRDSCHRERIAEEEDHGTFVVAAVVEVEAVCCCHALGGGARWLISRIIAVWIRSAITVVVAIVWLRHDTI